MPIKISPRIKTLREYFKKLDNDLKHELLARITDKAVEYSVKNAKKHTKTGRLERNIDSKIHKDKLRSEIFVSNQGMLVDWRGKKVNYGIFVHFGTKPHTITPRRKKALRWVENNKFVFAKLVKHPGYKGDPFLYKGVYKAFKEIDKIFNETIEETK